MEEWIFTKLPDCSILFCFDLQIKWAYVFHQIERLASGFWHHYNNNALLCVTQVAAETSFSLHSNFFWILWGVDMKENFIYKNDPST